MRSKLLSLAAASLLVTACATTPPAATAGRAAGTAVLDAHGGDATATLHLSIGPRRHVLDQLTPYDASMVKHVKLVLQRQNGAMSYDMVLDAGGHAVTLDVPVDALAGAVQLTHLARNTNYRVLATAYKQLDSDPNDVISNPAASVLDLPVVTDDDLALTLNVVLADRDVQTVINGAPAAIDDDPGTAGTQSNAALQDAPAIAYSRTSNCYLAVWRDLRDNVAMPQPYGQILATDGTPQGAPFLISLGTIPTSQPTVTWDGTRDRFLVTWQGVMGGSGDDLRARFVLPNGTMPDTSFGLVGTGDAVNRLHASVLYNATDDRYFMAWEHQVVGSADKEVHAMTFDGLTGVPASNELMVAGAAGEVHAVPAVALIGATDRYVVGWRAPGASKTEVRLQRLQDAAGTLGALGTVSLGTASGNQDEPALVYNPDQQELLAVLDDDRNGAGDKDLYTQRLSSTFTTLGSLTPLLAGADAASGQVQACVAYNSNAHEYLIGWRDEGIGGQIGLVHCDPTGTVIGARATVQPENGELQATPALGYASKPGENNALLLWANGNDGSQDIFYTKINSRMAP